MRVTSKCLISDFICAMSSIKIESDYTIVMSNSEM